MGEVYNENHAQGALVPAEIASLAPIGTSRGSRRKPSASRHFRHELKYYVSDLQVALISQRLSMAMDLDPNADANREYHIRSLYFDDVFDSAVMQKLAGNDWRKKYRIRIYNFRDDLIKLECKEKIGQYIHKRSLEIDRRCCDSLLYGDARRLSERYDHPLAKEFYAKIRSEGLHPAVIVDYRREAYISPVQDVRITLDKQLHTGLWDCNLFDDRLPTVPALLDGQSVLEVKFSKHFPEYFRYLIQGYTAQRSAASKYVLCRQFE